MSNTQIARENLQIVGVCVAEIQAKIDEDIVPESVQSDYMGVQAMNRLKSIRSFEFEDDNNQIKGYHFSYVCGLRYVLTNESEAESPKVLFSLTVEFVAKYRSVIEINDEALEGFGSNNVGYHVWPYWRELAHSTLARFDLPKTPIHHYFVNEV